MSGSLQPNAKNVGQTKLSPALKLQVCQRVGEYWQNNQILEWLQSEHNITLNSSTITYYRTSDDWQDAIQRARATYNANLDDCAGASSHWRINELMTLYASASKDGSSPARRAERQRILEQMAAECPGMAALAGASPIQITLPDWAAAGVGLIKPDHLKGD